MYVFTTLGEYSIYVKIHTLGGLQYIYKDTHSG
jgi:hypothetical protein